MYIIFEKNIWSSKNIYSYFVLQLRCGRARRGPVDQHERDLAGVQEADGARGEAQVPLLHRGRGQDGVPGELLRHRLQVNDNIQDEIYI